MHLPTWLRLTIYEFRRSCGFGPAPDGRDFLSLTLLYAILIALGVILISAHRGIVVNFGDSLLGRIEGYGSPIRVSAHVERIRNNIDDDALALVNGKTAAAAGMEGLQAFPLREAEEGLLRLPSVPCPEGSDNPCPPTWTPTKDGVRQPFSGWIVADNNPMWLEAMRDTPEHALDPLTLVLNRNVVAGRLDVAAYRSALSDYLPPAILQTLPSSLDEMEEIHLFSEISLPAVSVGQGESGQQRASTAYRVVQVDSLPSLSQVAFLILTPTASGLLLDQESAGIAFDPHLQRDGEAVIYGLNIFYDAPGMRKNRDGIVNGLKACLGPVGQWSEDRFGDYVMRLRTRLPELMVHTCLEQSGLVAERDYLVQGRGTQALSHGEVGWQMRCGALPIDLHHDADRVTCAEGDDRMVERRWFRNWDRADVYVENRRDVIAVRDNLITAQIPVPGTTRSSKAFELGTLYSDSISRFGYLLGVVDWIVRPIAGLAAFAVIYILGTQLFVLVSRRRKAYGTLLARGVTEGGIQSMLFVQILTAILIGAILGFIIAETAQYLFASAFETTVHAQTARTELGQRNTKLIDQLAFSDWDAFRRTLRDEWVKVLSVAGFIAVVSLAFVRGLLRFCGLRVGAAPIDLLK